MSTLANNPESATAAQARNEPSAPPTVELELILDPTLGTGPLPQPSSRSVHAGWQERLTLLTDLAAERLAEDPDVVRVLCTTTGSGDHLHLHLECSLVSAEATERVSTRVDQVLIPDLEEQLGIHFAELHLGFTVA